jgi:hypothetical protein
VALSFLTIEVEIEDVRGELVDPTPFRACRGEFRLNILVIRTRCLRDSVRQLFEELISFSFVESLILAQDERWRRA